MTTRVSQIKVVHDSDARPGAWAAQLPPPVSERLRQLVKHLAGNDFSLVLLDIVQLERAVKAVAGRPADLATALVYGDDGADPLDVCEGPDALGNCPRSLTSDGRVQCAGCWLMASGFAVKAAPDVRECPLVTAGVPQRAQAPRTQEATGRTS